MARRYAFWRSPSGHLYRGNDDKYAPTTLLAEIGKSASINTEGKIQWEGLSVLRLEQGVRGALVIIDSSGDELNATDTWEIVRTSMSQVIKNRSGNAPIAPAHLMTEVDRRAAAYYRQPTQPYILCTSLSIRSFPAKSLKCGDCEIASMKRRMAIPPIMEIESDQSRYGKHIKQSKYQRIRIRTSGRTIHEAASKALNALHLLRGYWNLFATYRSWQINIGSNRTQSLGVVHAGPVHTLHNPGGSFVNDMFWYEQDYIEDAELFQPPMGWPPIEKDRRWAARRVRYLPYRREVEGLLVRYALAHDQVNLDVAFLR